MAYKKSIKSPGHLHQSSLQTSHVHQLQYQLQDTRLTLSLVYNLKDNPFVSHQEPFHHEGSRLPIWLQGKH